MMFTKSLREGVRRGEITTTVRFWLSPRVSVGKRYRMEEGEIEVDSIEMIGFPGGAGFVEGGEAWQGREYLPDTFSLCEAAQKGCDRAETGGRYGEEQRRTQRREGREGSLRKTDG